MDDRPKAQWIAEMIEALAGRFRTFHEMQAVRAFLLWSAFNVCQEDIRRQLQARGNMGFLILRGRNLVRDAVDSQLITMAEMRAWLKDLRDRRTT